MEEGKPAEKMEKEKEIGEVRGKVGPRCETTTHFKKTLESQEMQLNFKGMKTHSSSLIMKKMHHKTVESGLSRWSCG